MKPQLAHHLSQSQLSEFGMMPQSNRMMHHLAKFRLCEMTIQQKKKIRMMPQ